MRARSAKFVYLALALSLGWTASAHAGEGVIEINQAAATAGGVIPGDAAGFPVTLANGGLGNEPTSYRLTGPLTLSGGDDGIEIIGDNITLDLNGFAIKCILPGPSGQCTGHGVSSSTSANVTVRNGSIEFMEDGVALTGAGARVEDVRAYKNHGNGIHLGADCTVIDSSANDNGINGIVVASGCLVQGNTANNNGQSTNNTAGDGIDTTVGCNVTGNTVRTNEGRGLNLSTATGYSNNVIQGNTTGTVLNGVSTGQNLCNGLTTCP